jgi:hypothetical protein
MKVERKQPEKEGDQAEGIKKGRGVELSVGTQCIVFIY